MANCPRCERYLGVTKYKCANCGTIYCPSCSGEAPGEVGKKSGNCCTNLCPVCGKREGKEF